MLLNKNLNLIEYNKFRQKMTLMDTVVIEDLYSFYHGCDQAPYDYYNADYLVSPNSPEHREYFSKVKPLVVELYDLWYPKLMDTIIEDERDLHNLKLIGKNINDAKDMVDLVWGAMQLRSAVSAYLGHLRSASYYA
ncbi:MAG TPA: hypothetical protein EYG78_06745 [Sulfurovum sp.]|nr:hypothetical protein [Sulfurovum sp.]